MCSHEMIDRDDTLMYTKGYNFPLFDFLTKWVLQLSSPESLLPSLDPQLVHLVL
jgi:hypothetical protein